MCYKCQKFGHKSTVCNNKDKCGKCAGDHKTSTCKSIEKINQIKIQKKCANCDKIGHSAWDKDCPRVINRIMQINPGLSYSQIVKPKQPNLTQDKDEKKIIKEQLEKANEIIREKEEVIDKLTKKVDSIELMLLTLTKQNEYFQKVIEEKLCILPCKDNTNKQSNNDTITHIPSSNETLQQTSTAQIRDKEYEAPTSTQLTNQVPQ